MAISLRKAPSRRSNNPTPTPSPSPGPAPAPAIGDRPVAGAQHKPWLDDEPAAQERLAALQELQANSEDDFFYQNSPMTQNFVATVTPELEAQAAIERTTDALGQSGPVRELTADEYSALTPRQQAAIDANTALYNAIMADREAGDSGERVAGYDETVFNMFGEFGGSDTYSPRAVAVLNELGLEPGEGSDLDQYLNLSRLIRESDLDRIPGENEIPSPVQSYDPEGARILNAVAFSQAANDTMARVLSQGQTLLDAARANSGDVGVQLFGAPGATDQYAQDLSLLFDRASSREDGLTPEDFGLIISGMEQDYQLSQQDIFDYLERRLRGSSYGGDADPARLTPDEFRSLYYSGGA